MHDKLICVAGPTASGKTALSIALAKKLNTEIISADSMQIYRRMDIGTAKPSLEERDGVVHYMFDVAEPGVSYSVALYVEQADKYVQSILQKGKIPIITGGTGLYMDALIEGSVFSGDEKNTEIRDKFKNLAEKHGNQYVHSLLEAVDPESAKILHPNNTKRVIRALEVYHQTGMTIFELNKRNKRPEPKYTPIMIGLCPENREILYERINRRVDLMVEQGLIEETKYLQENGFLKDTAAQAIGYKELVPYLSGESTLSESIEKLKQNSRNYAKRQLTWLRRDDRIKWIYYNDKEDFEHVCQNATEYLTQFGVL